MQAWRHSITLRLSLAFALLATVVFTALGLYFSRAADAHMAELDAHELFGKLVMIGHIGSQAPSANAMAVRLNDALSGEHGVVVAIDNQHGAVFRWPSTEAAEPLAAAAVPLSPAPLRLPLHLPQSSAEYRVIAAEMTSPWGGTAHVVVARNIHHHTDFLDQLQRDFWWAIVAAALLTAIVGALIVRHGMRPVLGIARTAGRISAGQLAERIPENAVPAELAELVSAFNAMLGRLEASFARLSDFSADLAHELRTPIHSLRMQTEVSLAKPRSLDEYRDLLASNLEEYERLARMIADMLFLAKADHGLLVPQCENIALRALGQHLIDYYGLLADGIAIELQGAEIEVAGDRLMLERALGNLLVNAIHHTPSGGQIALTLNASDNTAEISISNSGPGIPPEALNRIFDRFVRLDPQREGSGLGLAITRSIIVAHGGEIRVESQAAITCFVITLPRPSKP